MKKLLTIILLLFLTFSGSAAKTPEFSAKIILTKAVNIEDQFRYILPGRPPVFPQVTKVVCGERFFVEIVFFNAAAKNGSVLLGGKITMSAPGGKKEVIKLKERSQKVTGQNKGVYLFPQSLVRIVLQFHSCTTHRRLYPMIREPRRPHNELQGMRSCPLRSRLSIL